MTKLKVSRAALAATSGLVLSLGVVGMASAHFGSDMGQPTNTMVTGVKNDNDINVKNTTDQKSTTGKSEVEHNGTGGDAMTGNAGNTNGASIAVGVTNHAPVMPDVSSASDSESSNSSVVKTNVKNDNDVKVTNTTNQNAVSGAASVENNKDGGNATSGSATNTNSTSIAVTVTN